MTREKAIRLLTTKRAQPSTDYQMAEVYTMAIQALSQEPYDVQKIYDLKTGLSDWVVLPKLEQKPCEDIAQERYKDLCEYFGGAKDILKSREDFKAWLGRVKWHIRKAEELYEKAFMDGFESCSDLFTRNKEQQPCADAISRDAVINLIRGCNTALEEPRIFDCHNAGVKFEQYITELPPVTQKPIEYEDAISREAVYQLLMNMASSAYGFEEIRRIVDDLPPVTQKPIECDAIRREDAINIASLHCLTIDETVKALEQLPSVNPQPLEHFIEGVHAMGYREGYKDAQKQKYGKWIKQTLSVKPFGEDTVLCDQCAFMTDKDSMYNYCPNCGCRMVEPQESEDKE